MLFATKKPRKKLQGFSFDQTHLIFHIGIMIEFGWLGSGFCQKEWDHFSPPIFLQAPMDFNLVFPASERAVTRVCGAWNVDFWEALMGNRPVS